MKHSISKETEAYLRQLEEAEQAGVPITEKAAEEYMHNPDPLDQLIKNHNLQIVGLNFYPELDLMLLVLNNKKVMKRNLSDFKRLKAAKRSDLEVYELSRYGVHWPNLDEDLSLKGFLQYEITHMDVALVA